MERNSRNEIRKGSERLFRLFWGVWLLTLITIGYSSVHDSIQAAMSDPVFFSVREKLGRTPGLSPRIKIFGFDDKTVGFLNSTDMSSKDFALLIENIAKRKPKVIIIDKLFGLDPPEPGAREFLDQIRALNIPLYTGAVIHPAELKYKRTNELSEEMYGLDRWIDGDIDRERPFIIDNFQNINGYLYAYASSYEGIFKGFGNIGFNRIGSALPLVLFGDKIVPHLALYAADQSVLRDKQLVINHHPVPLTSNGGVLINHRPTTQFYPLMKGMKGAISRARSGQVETNVVEGDVVVLLFNFYTGSTDFLENAPFGSLPGGLLVSTLVDSVLENRWLKPFDHVGWLILVMAIIGTILARTTGPVVYWLSMIIIGFVYFCLVNYLFSYHNIMVPWVLPISGLVGCGTIRYVRERLDNEVKAVAMQNQFLIERALRLEEEKTNIQLTERLNLGRAVQQILLPPLGAQEHGPFVFSMSYTPSQEMSGDWIYVWGQNKAQKRIFIGDVVGKGPSAAIPVAILIGILGECERVEMTMEATFQHLNRRILELFDREVTCSCSAIVMYEQSTKVELYNAGSPGWFYRSTGKARHISMRSNTLGIGTEAYIACETLELTPGSFIFNFTDGYMEGARAFKRLITKLGTMDISPEFVELQDILDEVGKPFRLEDDKSLLVIATKVKAKLMLE